MENTIIEVLRNNHEIPGDFIAFLDSTYPKYLYGNGAQSATVIGFLRDMAIDISGVLAFPGYEFPTRKGYWKDMLEYADKVIITELSLTSRLESAVLLTCPNTMYDDAEALLKQLGFANIYRGNWERNQYIRDIIFGDTRYWKRSAEAMCLGQVSGYNG